MCANPANASTFQWTPQPQAAGLVATLLDGFRRDVVEVAAWRQRLSGATGTRLIDWIDYFAVRETDAPAAELRRVGFRADADSPVAVWRHPAGLFPPIVVSAEVRQLTLKVESVDHFVAANLLSAETLFEGEPGDSFRRARVAQNHLAELWVCERHGDDGFATTPATRVDPDLVAPHRDAFRARPRPVVAAENAFSATRELFAAAVEVLGRGRAADLFFSTEREYWQGRNAAAQTQKGRQDAVGMGWANHDHHTYRCSREHFVATIALFEQMGFVCRERFYAGAEAGWGAQVLQHPTAGVVIFADVDLSPDEVAGDFSHAPLVARDALGTVGLWCALHGESLFRAGMHHLECQFDFDLVRAQLAELGVATMRPFTELPYLKQAFTQAQPWVVDPRRVAALEAAGRITAIQAARFRDDGALGSHLEILQRDEGYQGFNQSGINEIIRATDPRCA